MNERVGDQGRVAGLSHKARAAPFAFKLLIL